MIIKRTQTENWIKLNRKKENKKQKKKKKKKTPKKTPKQTTKLDMKNIYSWCH